MMIKRTGKILAIFFVLLVCLFFLARAYFLNILSQKTNISEETIFRINKGESIARIIKKLEEKKIIPENRFSYWAIRLMMPNLKVKQGEYLLKPQGNLQNIIVNFAEGKVVQRKIVITEGSTVSLVKEILEKEESLTGEITEEVEEGFIYPDTYYFEANYDRNKLLKKMKENMNNFLEEIIVANQIIKNKRDLVILASIVEKETSVEEERAIVASVFLNRLKNNIPLQADPTVIYGLSAGRGYIERSLNLDDLHRDSEFNTYTRRGLPPTAIAIPSINSLKAVMKPATTSYIYFVANNKGGHCFANNLLKHNINVVKYRKNQENNCD